MISSISINGIEKTLSLLKNEQYKIEKKTTEFIEKLTELGVSVANAYYSDAQYAGDKDVIVEGISEGKYKASIRAFGNAVLFIEFGTGILRAEAPEAKEELSGSSGIVNHGEYGQGRGASEKGWFYKGTPGIGTPPGTEWSTKYPGLVHTYGQDAYPAMYWTKKYLEEQLTRIMNEVFND